MTLERFTPWSVSIALLVTGCGAGTAAAVSGGGDSGGSSNSASLITGLSLEDARVSPARVRFTLADEESDPASVRFFYECPGSAAQSMAELGGFTSMPVVLETSAAGVAYALDWIFTGESGIPSDGSYVPTVRVFATVDGGVQEIVLGANADAGGLGNDAPVVSGVQAPAVEASGIVLVKLVVSDSSNDEVSVIVEYDIVGDAPDAGWRLARPAQAKSTPDYGIDDVVANASGTALAFFWDTNIDLAELEHDVRVRFTAVDRGDDGRPLASSDAALSPQFRVDNNEEPIAEINDLALVLNEDSRRGVPVPFRVIDEESDEVLVVFQWRRADEEFIELPDDPAALAALQSDPAQRAAYHLCTEYPTYVGGITVPVDATHVRLPELASSAATVLAHGIVGRSLEFLRPPNRFEPVANLWSANPLVQPVAALPVDDGAAAIVLDRPAAGSWRLQRVELASGSAKTIASGAGDPSALSFDRDEVSVLVASSSNGSWILSRAGLVEATSDELASGSGSIRGVASLSANAALITVGDSLSRVDWSDPSSPVTTTLRSCLSTPWGVVIDPLRPNSVYLAERDAVTKSGVGAIRSLRLDGLVHSSITSPPFEVRDDLSEHAFDRPESLAITRSGARLLAIAQGEPRDEVWSVQGYDFAASEGNGAYIVQTGFNASPHSIAAAPDGCAIVTATAANDLYVAGGVRLRATIDAYDAPTQTVALDDRMRASTSPAARWRIRVPDGREPRRPTSTSFVWDSRDIHGAGEIVLRAIPTDAELGIESVLGGFKSIPSALASEFRSVGDAVHPPQDILAADLDGDGDTDLATANMTTGTLSVHLQGRPGEFASPAMLLSADELTEPFSITAADIDGDEDIDLACTSYSTGALLVFRQLRAGEFSSSPMIVGARAALGSPSSLVAADLDHDCDIDLACANVTGESLAVFFQSADGTFPEIPLVLGDTTVTSAPVSIAAADLDGDGDNDLVSANNLSNSLTVFFQTNPGEFSLRPLILGGTDLTAAPERVVAADLDADGDFDLAMTSPFMSQVFAYFQTSHGSYSTQPQTLGGPSMTPNVLAIGVSDLDADGDNDVVVGDGGLGELAVFYQLAPGQYSESPVSIEIEGDVLASAIAPADLDGDGDVDLALANLTRITLSMQSSPGRFTSAPTLLEDPDAQYFPGPVAIADFDRDGDVDVVSGFYGDHKVTLYEQVDPGVFLNAPRTIGSDPAIRTPYAVIAADLDGDGNVDVASANFEQHALAVFFQEEDGAFSDPPLLLSDPASMIYPAALATADLDGDGDLDLASASYGSHRLNVFFQSSPGSFSAAPLVLGDGTTTANPHSIVAADLDGDDDCDLASANFANDTLTIFFQTSAGVFSSLPVTLSSAQAEMQDPRSLTAADLDGDGDLDLASANAASRTLAVFFQEGPGVYSRDPVVLRGTPTQMETPYFVVATDLDGDGDNDLATANRHGNSLTAFLQTRPGVFASFEKSFGAMLDGCDSLAAGDVDGDGDVDLVTASSLARAVQVYWCTD